LPQSRGVKPRATESFLIQEARGKTFGRMACILMLLVACTAMVHAQQFIPFTYTTNNGRLTITGYSGIANDVAIPDTIQGMPVGAVGDNAFAFKTALTSVTIPNSVSTIGISAFDFCNSLRTVTIGTNVSQIRSFAFRMCHGLTNVVLPGSITNIGYNAFFACNNLTTIRFKGNAPSLEEAAFTFAPATAYYTPGTAGWQPRMVTTADGIGVRTNGFGFAIAGTPGLGFMVESNTNFSNLNWSQVGSYTLTSNSLDLIDLSWTNNPACFYRAGSMSFGGLPMSPTTP
jgi:hypothetical protein